MTLIQVKSSNLKAIGYDYPTKTLTIQFVEGSTYNYHQVPSSTYEDLMKSSSKGSFFQQYIVGQFKFEKVSQKESNMKKEATKSAATTPAVQPSTPAKQEAAKPVEAAKPATPEQPVSKQQLTIMRLVVALREQRKIEVTPAMLVQDGKFINLIVGKEWPTIRVGNSGGITVMELRSYANAFDAAVQGDVLYAKQNGRDAKKVAAPAPAAATPAPAAKAEAPTPTAKKQKAHAEIEKQLATA